MLFHDSAQISSALNTVAPIKLIGKRFGLEYHNLQLNVGLPHKQTKGRSDWQLHYLYLIA